MTEQEKAAIERLKQHHDETWIQLIDALGPPLYNKLMQMTGDKEKASDYLNDFFLIIVQAIGKMK